jgi:hypothetical protein
LGGGERRNSLWNVLHDDGLSAGGERRGGRHLVVVVTGSWLREKSKAQAVLTVASTGRSHGQRCRATVVRLWTQWRPLRSWTERSRHDSAARQWRQRGAGVCARCGLRSKAMTEQAERRKMASFCRWTAATDKGDLRRRTWPVVTDGARSPSVVSHGSAGGRPVRLVRPCL